MCRKSALFEKCIEKMRFRTVISVGQTYNALKKLAVITVYHIFELRIPVNRFYLPKILVMSKVIMGFLSQSNNIQTEGKQLNFLPINYYDIFVHFW